MAYGDIGPTIDTEIWWPAACYFPFISHARDDIYLFSNGGPFSVRSINIDNEGNISAWLDSIVLEAGLTSSAKYIHHIDGDIFAVAFAGAVNAKVVTFTCDAAGTLGGVIDTEDLAVTPANKSYYPFMLRGPGNIFIVAYTDNADDGWIKTVRINNDGSIDPFIASWECEAAEGHQPWLVHVAGEMYAIIISDTNVHRGIIRTFAVDALGNITPTGFTWFFDMVQFNNGVILPISPANGTYAIFYWGPGNAGWIKTLYIRSDGAIFGPLDTWNYDPGMLQNLFAIEVSGNAAGNGTIFAVGHTANARYQVWTVEILYDGTITKTMIDTLILVPADWGNQPTLIRISGLEASNFAICYEEFVGVARTGHVRSLEIEGRHTPVVRTEVATEIT